MRHTSCIRPVLLSAFVLAALLSPFPGLAPAAQAATVHYGDAEGTNDSVTGNTGITNFGFPPQNTGNASDNTVNVTGGTVNILINGGYHTATDGNGDATASNNQVNIETFTGSTGTAVDGGSATTWQVRATATAHNNTVDITGGQFGVVRGSLAQSTDGPASASGNTLRPGQTHLKKVYKRRYARNS